MGITVAEYFAQKAACNDCVEHGTEHHCVTTLLSRVENCIFYNVNRYTTNLKNEDLLVLKSMRDLCPEPVTVDYYVRCEKIIEKLNLSKMSDAQQTQVCEAIYQRYVKNIIAALHDSRTDVANDMIEQMLINLEA